MKKMTALGMFEQLTKELGRMPSLDEFLDTGYKRASYYNARKDFKGLQKENKNDKEVNE